MQICLIAPATRSHGYLRALRELAEEVARRTGFRVETVVSGSALPGSLAQSEDVRVVPLFLASSPDVAWLNLAGVSWLKSVSLSPLASPECDGFERIARILADNAASAALPASLEMRRARVILVDHGSADPACLGIREKLAIRLRELLGSGSLVETASMEKVSGAPGPFLAERLEATGGNEAEIVVLPQFLFPGRHAGPGGDIERICVLARARVPGRRIVIAPLVGEHPDFLPLVLSRIF